MNPPLKDSPKYNKPAHNKNPWCMASQATRTTTLTTMTVPTRTLQIWQNVLVFSRRSYAHSTHKQYYPILSKILTPAQHIPASKTGTTLPLSKIKTKQNRGLPLLGSLEKDKRILTPNQAKNVLDTIRSCMPSSIPHNVWSFCLDATFW